MHRPSLARALFTVVAGNLAKAIEVLAGPTREELQRLTADALSRSPRNRAEARRLVATKGRIARVGGAGSPSPLLSLHRRIEQDQARQAERHAAGRHVWA